MDALPSGAAGCSANTAAAQGFHADYGPDSISKREGLLSNLTFGGTSVTINNVLLENATGYTVPTRTDISWTIAHNGSVTMRGVLFRVEMPATGYFTVNSTDPRLQIARYCDLERGNVIGMTHRDRSDKQNVSGVVRFETPGTASVDVTVVYRNGRVAPGNQSFYAYNNFKLTVTGPAGPVPPPVAAPVAPPTAAVCDINGCTSIFGYTGQIMSFRYGTLCTSKCVLPSLVWLRRIGLWRCGTCNKGP